MRKNIIALVILLFAARLLLAAPFTLTIAHINDTHAYLSEFDIPLAMALDLDGKGKLTDTRLRTEAGGFPRLATCIDETRKTHANVLFLDAGDVFTGTLFSRLYHGQADAAFLNYMQLDAQALGNHEFDHGPKTLSEYAAKCHFPLLCANGDFSQEPLLKDKIKPYVVLTVGGQKIGVIGVITPDVDDISSPGETVAFSNPAPAVEKAVTELKAQGVNKIIVLSHLGYEADQDLAESVNDIDVIVGGHSHTLLGDSTAFAAFGAKTEGPYPTVVNDPSGHPVYIVTARSHTFVFGCLDVTFNDQGVVQSCSGQPYIVCGDAFQAQLGESYVRLDADHHPEIYRQVCDRIAASPVIKLVDPASWALDVLATYQTKVDSLCQIKVADIPADLLHVKMPGMKDGDKTLTGGSQIVPLIADAFLWKVRRAGYSADVCVLNGGNCRSDITAPSLDVGTLYQVLPYENQVVIFDLSGADLRESLRHAVMTSLRGLAGAFPYVAGCRYTVHAPDSSHVEITELEIQSGTDKFVPVDDRKIYRIVTNSYMADGGDDYQLFSLAGKRIETGILDADAFQDYAYSRGILEAPKDSRVKIK